MAHGGSQLQTATTTTNTWDWCLSPKKVMVFIWSHQNGTEQWQVAIRSIFMVLVQDTTKVDLRDRGLNTRHLAMSRFTICGLSQDMLPRRWRIWGQEPPLAWPKNGPQTSSRSTERKTVNHSLELPWPAHRVIWCGQVLVLKHHLDSNSRECLTLTPIPLEPTNAMADISPCKRLAQLSIFWLITSMVTGNYGDSSLSLNKERMYSWSRTSSED